MVRKKWFHVNCLFVSADADNLQVLVNVAVWMSRRKAMYTFWDEITAVIEVCHKTNFRRWFSSSQFTLIQAVERGLRNPQLSPHLMGGDTEGWERGRSSRPQGAAVVGAVPGEGLVSPGGGLAPQLLPENLPFGCSEQTCLPFLAFLSVSFISDYALGRPALLNLYGVFVSLFWFSDSTVMLPPFNETAWQGVYMLFNLSLLNGYLVSPCVL